MVFFHIRLIHPETKEIYYESCGSKPELPSQEIIEKYKGSLLVIETSGTPKKAEEKTA